MERLTIQYKVDGVPKEIDVATNNPANIETAFSCWVYRTKAFTTKSFCKYINSKRDPNILCLPYNQIKK